MLGSDDPAFRGYFSRATWLLLSGSRAPAELGIHPRAGVGAPTITQGGVEPFLGNHFLRRKVLEVNKKQLVFLGRSGKKRGKPLFFLMVGSFSFSQNDHDSFQLVGIL